MSITARGSREARLCSHWRATISVSKSSAPKPILLAPMQPPKNTGGKVPDSQPGDPKGPTIPLLPIEDEIVKEVWGLIGVDLPVPFPQMT